MAQSQIEICEDEPRGLRAGHEKGMHKKKRSQDAAHLDHKHDRVAELVHRIEFYERIDQGTPDDLRFKKGVLFLFMIH